MRLPQSTDTVGALTIGRRCPEESHRMPRKAAWPPKVVAHRGRDYVRVRQDGRARDLPLGPAGSPEARAEYERIVREMEANGRRLPPPADPALTVVEAVVAYLAHAQQRYDYRQHKRIC